MKQLIKDVLEDMSHGPSAVTLASPIFRETIANAIVAAIKTNKKGWFLDLSTLDKKPKLTPEEKETQRVKESWVCDVCGKSTFEVEEDYLVHPKLHLGCALEEEVKGKDIKEQYIDACEDITERGKDRREGDRREKNWSQKKHEDKVFDEYAEDIDEQAFAQGRGSSWIDKLSEEVVSDNDTGYIYESPDGGKTVYKRKEGSDKRELVKDWKKIKNNE